MELGEKTVGEVVSGEKIAFLVPYPHGEAPSQRFRFEQYLKILQQNNYTFETYSFYSETLWKIMYQKGNTLKKALGIIGAFLKRFFLLFQLRTYKYVFIHRELAPLGPPVFEWIIAKILKKKIIYDFDDAIWLTDEKARLSNFIRCFWKVKYICKWSYKISCGNQYLADYASQWNSQVIVNPTTIDTNYHKPISQEENPLPVVGWTGSHSTLKYLDQIIPIVKELEEEFKLVVICNSNPNYDLKHFEFIPWSRENEIIELDKIDIGIMPLPNDPWTKGKCGFKALQYMALKKPVILTPVGVNKEIVTENYNGYFATNSNEWKLAFEKLFRSKELRKELGKKGQEEVKEKFSVHSNQERFLSLFA